MSYRYTVVTEFLYEPFTDQAEAIAAALDEALGGEFRVARRAEGWRGDYVSGWFKDLSGNDAREWFENLQLPVGFVVLTEWGEVWHKPAIAVQPEASPEAAQSLP